MSSFEGLADASLAAAMNIERYISGQTSSLSEYEGFIKLLDAPLMTGNETYKLINDARKLPIYRRAWTDVFGKSNVSKPSDELLKEISGFLHGAKPNKLAKTDSRARDLIEFCLSLNRLFLEENADAFESGYRTRVSHGLL